MCRQWSLEHIEKTVTLHVRTVAFCGRPHILDFVEGLWRYMCRQWRLDHIEKTVTLHVRTVVPLGHFRYSQRCRATVSLHVQTAVPRPRHYATCADWRRRVWLYHTRRRTPKILGVASQPCSTWSSQSVSRIMGLTVFEATKTKGSMSLSLLKDSCYVCGWYLDRIEKTVTRHVRTVMSLGYLTYSRPHRMTVSLHVQMGVSSIMTVTLYV